MRFILTASLLIISLASFSQSSPQHNSSIFLLKIDSSGNMISYNVGVSNSFSYGYFVNRIADTIFVYGYLNDSIKMDSLNYGADTANPSSKHVTLAFDLNLKCIQISCSSISPENQIRSFNKNKKYFVSTISDTLHTAFENIPNIGNKDIQVSVFENKILKWHNIFGTIHNDVPYSIYYDSLSENYFVTGYISYIDTVDQHEAERALNITNSNSSNLQNPSVHEYQLHQKNNENNIDSVTKYTVHPNPFSDFINVDVVTNNHINRNNLTFRLISSNGSLVKSGNIGYGTKQISGLSHLAPGTYYLSIFDSSSNQVYFAKLLKT